jgi:TRAP-type uncharacterized transport system substrate-binding protein
LRPAVAVRWLLALLAVQAFSLHAADKVSLLIGQDRDIHPQIGRDIAKFIARPAGITLQLDAANGPAESLQRLREGARFGLALLPSDTLPAYVDAAAGGHADASRIASPLRVIASLYAEEVYFIVRNDAPFESLQDIKSARIDVGPAKSGTALTVLTLYRFLFGEPVPDGNLSFLGPEQALVKLITDRTVDVVSFTSPQPARLLVNMKADARRFVKLLKFDANHPASQAILQRYDATTLRASSYPNLLHEDIPALSNRLYLVAYGQRRGDDELLTRIARTWCRNLPRLHDEGHAKWREIEPMQAGLKQGWQYATPVAREMARCAGQALPKPSCSQLDRVLGLCE